MDRKQGTDEWLRVTWAPGFWVALVLKSPLNNLQTYVGQVQATDEQGVRLTLIDWLIGTASGWDLIIPWDQIAGAFVATPDHDVEAFGEYAASVQQRIEGLIGGEER